MLRLQRGLFGLAVPILAVCHRSGDPDCNMEEASASGGEEEEELVSKRRPRKSPSPDQSVLRRQKEANTRAMLDGRSAGVAAIQQDCLPQWSVSPLSEASRDLMQPGCETGTAAAQSPDPSWC